MSSRAETKANDDDNQEGIPIPGWKDAGEKNGTPWRSDGIDFSNYQLCECFTDQSWNVRVEGTGKFPLNNQPGLVDVLVAGQPIL